MPLDPNIVLRARGVDLAPAASGLMALAQQRRQDQREQPFREQQLAQQKTQTELQQAQLNKLKEDQNFKSVALGAELIAPFVESGDYGAATDILNQRISQIEARGGDSTESREVLQQLQSGDPQQIALANRNIGIVRKLGRLTGVLTDQSAPKFSSVKRTESGGLIGLNERTGQFEDLPTPGGVRVADGSQKISIEQKGAGKEQEALAKSRVSRFEEMQNSALAAEEQNAGLSSLENMDVNTGFGEGGKAQIARVINALGGDGQAITGVDPANVQAFNAVTGKLVLDVMASQKGPQTDRDYERIKNTIPNIGTEAAAKTFNINSLRALNLRRMEMADFYEQFLDENETLKGADRAWSKFKRETPMLSDSIKNPDTGLPMFFYEFKDRLLEKNPGASSDLVIEAWRKKNGGN